MPRRSPAPGPRPDGAALAAECLRTLAHPDRLRIVEALLKRPYPVTELAERCGLALNAASMHLRLMRDRGLLAMERDGRRVYYRVAEPHLAAIMRCVQARFGPIGPGRRDEAE